MSGLAQYLDAASAGDATREIGAAIGATEFVAVRNLDYVPAPRSIYPLAPHANLPLSHVTAFAVDMDGTSTTTEPLALHALEYMVRRFTGLLAPGQWAGLDHAADYPHVIGNSNFRHAEFLLGRYRDRFSADSFREAFFEAVCWTLASMTDPQRRRDVTGNAINCGLAPLMADAEFKRIIGGGPLTQEAASREIAPLLAKYGGAFHCAHDGARVPALLDIYYMRYHAIMRAIEQGDSRAIARDLLGDENALLIAPMPAYDIFVALIKGWLGKEAGSLYEPLVEQLVAHKGIAPTDAARAKARLVQLGRRFQTSPARFALVTASIAYEAHSTMREVFRVMATRVPAWPVSNACRERILSGIADYLSVFDAFVNASDACEHRLKPHPDLYSLALSRMAIPRSEYATCVGLEDTEPGILSLRTAGIGCAIALPNHDTSRQNYQAATRIVKAGLPELILTHHLLLSK